MSFAARGMKALGAGMLAAALAAYGFSAGTGTGRSVPRSASPKPAAQEHTRSVHPATAPPAAPQMQFLPAQINALTATHGGRWTEGGPAINNDLGEPSGIAADAAGNIYIADYYYQTIEKIDATTHDITTIAGVAPSGGGEGGGGGGEARPSGTTAASRPTATQRNAMTPAQRNAAHFGGHARAADPTLHAARLQPAAQAVGAQLEGPVDVKLAPDGTVYFVDSEACVVYKIASDGSLTVVAGAAGNCGFAGDGNAATSAQLNYPEAIAFDSTGNLFIADSGNYVVRKVDTTGKISTIAGQQGVKGDGYTGNLGQATDAALGYSYGIAVDAAGNVYVSDDDNGTVRQIAVSTGIISWYAGDPRSETGADDGDGGKASAAGMLEPDGMAFDAAGDLYVADYGAGTVRKIDTARIIWTVAGNAGLTGSRYIGDGGPATQAQLGATNDVAIDPAGNVLVTLDDANVLVQVGPNGVLDFGTQSLPASGSQELMLTNTGNASLTFSGPPAFNDPAYRLGTDTNPDACNFTSPLAPGGSCEITVSFSASGAGDYPATMTVTDDAGTQTMAITASAMNPPATVNATLPSNEITGGQSITLTTNVSGSGAVPTGSVTLTDYGSSVATQTLDGSGNASFNLTPAVGYHDYVVTYNGDSNYSGASSGDQYLQVDQPVASITLMATPATVTFAGSISATAAVTGSGPVAPTGNVRFVMGGHQVALVPLDGTGHASANFAPNTFGHASVQATYVGDGNYAAAASNAVPITVHGGVLSFVPSRTSRFAGIPTDDNHGGYGGDGGPATSARFNYVSGIAIDSVGNVYISDASNGIIRKVDAATGNISTYAGQQHTQTIYQCYFSGDNGPATSAYLCNPDGLVFDANDNLYFSDYGNNAVRRVDHATHVITTVAGTPQQGGYNGENLLGTASELDNPQGLAFDAAGNLYIADQGNHLVRKLDTTGHLNTVAGKPYSYGQNPTAGVAATQSALNRPVGVAVDSQGNLYIADNTAQAVFKVDHTTQVLTYYAGSSSGSTGYPYGDGGLATSASLQYPEEIVFDPADNLYIADYGHETVRKVDHATGIITAVVGAEGAAQGAYYTDPTGQPSTNISTSSPYGLAIDGQGALYMTNTYVNDVLKFGPSGQMLFSNAANGASETLSLTNTGDATVTFSGTPSVSGPFTLSPAASNACGSTLAAGASCYWTVAYNGSSQNSGAIQFSDDAVLTPQTVSLQLNTAPAASSTQLIVYGSPAKPGDEIDLFASVSTTGLPPTGTVSFYEGAKLLGTAGFYSNGIAYIAVTNFTQGDHVITAVYSGDLNYAASTSAPQTATVTGPGTAQTITLGTLPTPSYADSTFSVSASASSGLPVTITVLSGPASGTGPFTITGAGVVHLEATQSGNSTYAAATPVDFTVTVAPATLTVTANNASRAFDQANPALSYSITGYVRGENSSVVSGAAALSTTALGTSPPGPYPIVPTQGTLTAANYTFAFVNGTLTIAGQSAQSITFGRLPPLSTGMSMTLTARATSGLPVSYSVSGPATLSGNRLTVTGPGPVTVTASQAGNSSYSAATPVQQSFTAQ